MVYLEWVILVNKASINILDLSFSHFLCEGDSVCVGQFYYLFTSLVKVLKGEDVDQHQTGIICGLDFQIIQHPSTLLSMKYYYKFYSEISVNISQFTFSYIPKSLL